MKQLKLLFFSLLISFSINAQDTFSICAVDTVTGEVGSAGASCVYISGQGIMILSDVHPGVGVIHTQAWYLQANQAYARSLMNTGIAPDQIIDSLVANDSQNNPALRQYGIVDFRDGTVRTAAFTGINTDDYKNHIIGPNYTIQGNILLGQQILDSMEARFLRAEGELACRLMEALQGANVAGADIRCLNDGTSSIGSFLRVAKPDDEPDNLYLQFNIPITEEGVDPIDSLQVLIDKWGGCNSTGVSENNMAEVINVYPNPAHDVVNFRLAGEIPENGIQLLIYNLQGKQVAILSFNGSTTLSWETGHPVSGLYTYQLIDKQTILSVGKFIVD